MLIHSFQEVRSGYKILERRDLSLQDLQAAYLTVAYP